jgi:hypothetical protein
MVAVYLADFKNKCPRIRSEEFVTPDDIVNCDPESSQFDISHPAQNVKDLQISISDSSQALVTIVHVTKPTCALPSLDDGMIS